VIRCGELDLATVPALEEELQAEIEGQSRGSSSNLSGLEFLTRPGSRPGRAMAEQRRSGSVLRRRGVIACWI